MTQKTPSQDPLDRLSAIVERFINATSTRMDAQDSRLDRHEQLMGQLADAIQDLRATTRSHGVILEELRAAGHRQDQMLEELRAANLRQERLNDFLLRQRPQDDEEEDPS